MCCRLRLRVSLRLVLILKLMVLLDVRFPMSRVVGWRFVLGRRVRILSDRVGRWLSPVSAIRRLMLLILVLRCARVVVWRVRIVRLLGVSSVSC